MPRPTVATVKALTARVKVPAGTAEKLLAHLERERMSVTVEADGYPSATMGGGTSGSGGDVTLTSVEAAVEARVYGTTRRDDHRHHTTAALACLQRAVTAIDELLGHLRALDKLDKPDKVDESEWCRHHLRSFPGDDPRGRVAVSVRRPARELCDQCSSFEEAEQVLPPLVILERWSLGKRPTEIQVQVALGRRTGAEVFARKTWAFGSEAK